MPLLLPHHIAERQFALNHLQWNADRSVVLFNVERRIQFWTPSWRYLLVYGTFCWCNMLTNINIGVGSNMNWTGVGLKGRTEVLGDILRMTADWYVTNNLQNYSISAIFPKSRHIKNELPYEETWSLSHWDPYRNYPRIWMASNSSKSNSKSYFWYDTCRKFPELQEGMWIKSVNQFRKKVNYKDYLK